MSTPEPAARRGSPLVRRIILGMVLGALLGEIARHVRGLSVESIRQAWPGSPPGLAAPLAWLAERVAGLTEPLGLLGSLIVNLIKGLAGPLLFVAVIDAFLRTSVKARGAAYLVGISLTNATLAILIGLTLSNTLQPGRFLDPPSPTAAPATPATLAPAAPAAATTARDPALAQSRKIDFVKDLVGFIPTNPIQPFLENSILSIVILAVLAGAALRRVKEERKRAGSEDYRPIEQGVACLYRALEIALSWIIATVPLAVFGVVARTVGQSGLEPLVGLGAYVAVAILGLALQVGLVYQAWILLVARWPLRRFWAGAKEAVAYAMGASSSLATLPVTLRCLERMGIRPGAARLAACVGTNLNNDGILLYEAMAVLFVAQVHRVPLDLGQQVLAAISCVVAGIGIAGIPEAGLISLALVLSTVGLPLEILPLLLTVDWVLSRCRAMTNVVSDILVAVLLDRLGVGGDDTPGPPSARDEPPVLVGPGGSID